MEALVITNLTWVQRIKLCIDIARGLNYLHGTTDYKQKLIHRDISSDNILLGENFKAKIANFGLSKFLLMHLCLYFVCIRSVCKRCPKLVCKLTESTILLIDLVNLLER
ncbi:putative non-specific protein-tyrosine kinase RLK-Pelle-LysM family [Helianthus debilis subsp. tardiflorus]